MRTPRRVIFVGTTILTILLFLFYDNRHRLTFLELSELSKASLCLFDMDKKYYVLDANWVDKNKYSRYISAHAGALPIQASDVTDRLAQKISDLGGAAFKAIEKDVMKKHNDDFTAELRRTIASDLRSEISRDCSAQFFHDMVWSYQVLEDLRASYLENNALRIRNGILHDLLTDTTDSKLKTKIDAMERLTIDRQAYLQAMVSKLSKFAPLQPPLSRFGTAIGGNMLQELGLLYTRRFLTEKRVSLNPKQFSNLQESHDKLVWWLRKLRIPPPEVYSGDGIVVPSTKENLPGAIGIIIQLRELGSELPVEVILDSEGDYNEQACKGILPQLKASCKVIERELTRELIESLKLKDFQMKVMAILVSSFDNTIVLDSDNWPVKNPDILFTSEPFLESKFIVWPDAWHKGVSPLYYDIARFEVSEPVRRDGLPNNKKFSNYASKNIEKNVLFHDLGGLPLFRGVESGQLVISKREHFRSLFLTAYYNIFGPLFYYPLLYQGTFGEGDRETYVPALHVMKEPYYMCDYPMTFVGVERKFETNDNIYMDESTMVQRDPQQSLRYMREWRRFLRELNLDTRLNPFQEGDYTKKLRKKFHDHHNNVDIPEALFLHVHDPKFNALYNERSEKTRYDYKSRYLRKIGEHNDILGTTDWELRFQMINQWVTCNGLTDSSFWESLDVDQKKTCQKMKDYVKILRAETNDMDAGRVNILETLKI